MGKKAQGKNHRSIMKSKISRIGPVLWVTFSVLVILGLGKIAQAQNMALKKELGQVVLK